MQPSLSARLHMVQPTAVVVSKLRLTHSQIALTEISLTASAGWGDDLSRKKHDCLSHFSTRLARVTSFVLMMLLPLAQGR